jgi:serine/threonine protein kinase
MSHAFSLSGFEVIEKLGEGGMATVWKARQVSLDRTVAIKILSSRMASDPDDVERFQNEARSAARLKHPGIVQVYDANAENDVYYFVMEFVDGYTAGEWVRRKGRLSEEDALLVAGSVADALGYAWEREGIIHCDIKPDNIIIDDDGSVKVADLGLARTISTMHTAEVSDEIMGTPAYISPEQAQGAADLDCGVDIYSLGAMLYHLVTGTMMFEGDSDDVQLESHADPDAHVTDPGELNHELSPGLCWLIERMTAKDRSLREADWEAVRADIARVRKGHLPHGAPLPEGASSVARSTKRTAATHQRTVLRHRTSEAAMTPFVRVMLVLGAVAVAVTAGVFYQSHANRATVASERGAPAPPQEDQYDEQARLSFEEACAYFKTNPTEYRGATRRFAGVITEAVGTRYARMAREAIAEIAAKKTADIELAKEALLEQISPLLAADELGRAVEMVEAYEGAYSSEILSWRQNVATKIRAKIEQQAAAQRQAAEQTHTTFAGVVDQTIGALLRQDGATARALLTDYVGSVGSGDARKAQELLVVVDGALTIDRRILESLELQTGQTVTLQFTDGPKEVVIKRVADGQVYCKHIIDRTRSIISAFAFPVAELSARERLSRMGSDSNYSVALAKGLMALSSGAYDHARNYLGMTHPLIAARLSAGVAGVQGGKRDGVAREALLAILRGYGCPVSGQEPDAAVWAEAVRAHRFDRSLETRVRESVAVFRRAYMSTDFAATAEPVLRAMEAAFGGAAVAPQGNVALRGTATPPPQQFGDTGGVVPPLAPAVPVALKPMSRLELTQLQDSPALVLAALLSRNPGSTAAGMRYSEKGDGRHAGPTWWIADGTVEDLEPLRALKKLKHFIYRAAGDAPGQLTDLTPLGDTGLKSLELANCQVVDLSVLSKLPLKLLILEDIPVFDLSPVRHGSLEHFLCKGTKVRDFSPLLGAPIKTLVMDDVPKRFLFSLPRIRSVNGDWLEVVGRKTWGNKRPARPRRR